jgi:tRNA threonylcarbamoyladenosine biosynthesis protein TsaE
MNICKTLDGVSVIAKEIIKVMRDGIVILQGDLAAGKTTLVKAVAKELGVNESVTSPTFSLQQCYDKKLFHYDIYNQGLEQFIALGLLEELEKEGLHLIEWGDDRLVELLSSAGFEVIKIEIEKKEDQRCYTLAKVS